MRFSIVTALYLAGAAFAAPADELAARGDPANNAIDLQGGLDSGTTYTCGGKSYTGADVSNAIQWGYNLNINGQTRGSVQLSFPANCPADMNRYEFPLIAGTIYNGGKSNVKHGDERAVYYVPGGTGSTGSPLVYYCGIMSHQGAAPGGFLLCPT